jgi:hypothetical protein
VNGTCSVHERDVWWDGVAWINLAWDSNQSWAFVNMAMNLSVL